jgi:hypothetical protein
MKLVKTPKLKTGDDAEAAKQLAALYRDAQDGVKRSVILGLYCFSIKAQLKHGQFQSWLKAHCPEAAYRTVQYHMKLASSAMEACGMQMKALEAKAQQLRFSHCGEILALPEAKVPDEIKPLREKLSSLIEGKSARQLFGEFKQAEEDDAGEVAPKHGRLKGQGGRKPVSISDQAAVLKQLAAEDWDEIELRLTHYADKFTMLTDTDAEIQIGILDEALKARSAWLKQPRNNRDPKAIQAMFHGKHSQS